MTSATAYRVRNATRDVTLASASGKASNMVTRGFGLMGRKSLPEGGGLIIQPCSSIISFFMRFPIDVIFVSDAGVILYAMHAMPAWRTSKIVRGSKYAVELPAGTLKTTGTGIGDTIDISPASE